MTLKEAIETHPDPKNFWKISELTEFLILKDSEGQEVILCPFDFITMKTVEDMMDHMHKFKDHEFIGFRQIY